MPPDYCRARADCSVTSIDSNNEAQIIEARTSIRMGPTECWKVMPGAPKLARLAKACKLLYNYINICSTRHTAVAIGAARGAILNRTTLFLNY
jgi:hypothetical protein